MKINYKTMKETFKTNMISVNNKKSGIDFTCFFKNSKVIDREMYDNGDVFIVLSKYNKEGVEYRISGMAQGSLKKATKGTTITVNDKNYDNYLKAFYEEYAYSFSPYSDHIAMMAYCQVTNACKIKLDNEPII